MAEKRKTKRKKGKKEAKEVDAAPESTAVPAEQSTWRDFSVASPLERAAAFCEAHIRLWGLGETAENDVLTTLEGHHRGLGAVRSGEATLLDGVGHVALIYSFGDADLDEKSAFETQGDVEQDFQVRKHCIPRWFGVNRFVLAVLQHGQDSNATASTGGTGNASATGLLLSAMMIAADASACTVPVFVPVGADWRGIYVGYERTAGGIVVRHDTRTTPLVPTLAHLEGILALHHERLGFVPEDATATTVTARLTFEQDVPEGSGEWRKEFGISAREEVDEEVESGPTNAMDRLRMIDDDAESEDEDVVEENVEEDSVGEGVVWGQCGDPIDAIQLCTAWPKFTAGTFVDDEHGTELIAEDAAMWVVSAIYPDNTTAQLTESVTDVAYAHVNAVGVRAFKDLFVAEVVKDDVAEGKEPSRRKRAADALQRLTQSTALEGTIKTTLGAVSRVGQMTHSLASTLNLDALPSAEQLEKSLSNIYERARTHCADELAASSNVLPRLPRLGGASVGSLFFSFVLSAFSLGKLRHIATLWRQFALDIRWHWDHAEPLPGTSDGDIDLRQCLLQQKLDLIDHCIQRKRERNENEAVDEDNSGEGWGDWDIDGPLDGVDEVSDGFDSALGRKRQLSMCLLSPHDDVPMYEPITQNTGVATEDVLRDREDMLARLGTDDEAAKLRTELQTAQLLSDMQAFKAANEGCVLSDFVRWHSPNDWVDDALSARMSSKDNVWHALWERAKPVTARAQKPLFDIDMEADRALDYLDTLSPQDLMSQILATVLQSVPVLLGWECGPPTVAALGLERVGAKMTALTELLERVWKPQRVDPMSREDLEDLQCALTDVEQLLGRATSLFAKFGPDAAEMIDTVLGAGEAPVLTKQQREAVSRFFRDRSDRIPLAAEWREFVIRTTHPRPFFDGRPTLNRTYALIGHNDVRVATSLSMDEGE